MRFRFGLVTGLATGYYLGARAGRQRYDQINRTIAKVRRSETFEEVTEKAKAVAEDAVEKAKETVDQLVGEKDEQAADLRVGTVTNGQSAETESTTAAGIILPTDPTSGGGYSSSR